jgi:hypothetical protein
MQLTLQRLETCNDCSLDSALETSSNASSGSSSPSWTTASFDVGPPTPAAKCAGLQLHDSPHADSAGQHKDHRGAYRRLQLEVPCSSGVQNDSNKSVPSARRVLPICGSYSSVNSWLEQQVSKRSSGGLIAACSHTPVDLIPALEAPITPVQAEQAAPALPAPAFQLLGLL